MPKGSAHFRSGTAMERWTESEPQTRQRLRGRATSGSSEGASPKVLSHCSRPMRRRKRRGNFPACKPLKYHKTGKSSRSEVRDDGLATNPAPALAAEGC